ncbi:hypothetical protein E2C01_095969 [Portunus trituberculatus]|uniref:Uncharacterized protein n=1 Tax=Portunus trituberculatus TaxID=210409 RepID=A0A5B7K1J6_PORTR|nr:hypothetical protein [Portunus trituberculatus]
MYKKLIVNHLREVPKKFAEFFRLSLEQFDFLVELIKDDIFRRETESHDDTHPPQLIASDCDYIHPLAARVFGASDDRSLQNSPIGIHVISGP